MLSVFHVLLCVAAMFGGIVAWLVARRRASETSLDCQLPARA